MPAQKTQTKKTQTKKTRKKTKPTTPRDNRPPVAIGHVRIESHDVGGAIDFFKALGLRDIFRGDRFGVLELRGGTHLIVSGRDKPIRKGTPALFDIMVDDIDAAHRKYGKKNFAPSEITSGSIHSSFFISAPSGHKLKITSSHAGRRAV
jgi:hypothetical protein